MAILTKIGQQALVHYSFFDLSEVNFRLDHKYYLSTLNKPERALWTSDWKDNISEIAWIEWSASVDFKTKDFLWRITPKETVKVYEVSTYEEYYSSELPKVPDTRSCIDYNALQVLGYDGFRVTDQGAALGHYFGKGGVLLLNGFDCESTVWLNTDWIRSIEPIGYLNQR